MTSKQFSSSLSTSIDSRYLYDKKFRTKNYQPIEHRLKKYSTVANGSYNNISLPYASGAYGVYRRTPHNLRGPPFIYTQLNRRINLRNKSHHSQQRQLSNSVSNDNDCLKYKELNSFINAIYHNEKEDDNNNEAYLSEIFNYTFPITGVSV